GVNINIIKNLLGNQITFVSIDQNGMVDGVWYKILDLEEGFYVPISVVPYDQFNGIPIGSNNPIFNNGKDLIKRIREMEKINNIILKIIQWLFLNFKGDLITFVEKYLVIDTQKVIDSRTYYDTRNIGHKLVMMASFEEAMSYIQHKVPTLIKNSKI